MIAFKFLVSTSIHHLDITVEKEKSTSYEETSLASATNFDVFLLTMKDATECLVLDAGTL